MNLALLIVVGTAACGWVLYFTSWFPELGGLLALGGLLSWLAFVFRLVPDDTTKALRESFAALLNRPTLLIAIVLVAVAFWRLSRDYSAIRIEAHQTTVPHEVWIYKDRPQEPVALSADGETNILLPVLGTASTTEHIKIKGCPMLSVAVDPRHRHSLFYPGSFQRHVVLVIPSAQLIKNLAGLDRKTQLQIEVRDSNMKVLKNLNIEDFAWFPLWVGCSEDVVLTEFARSELNAVAKVLAEPRASVFAFPPRSEPKWYCSTCSNWSDAEWELPESGSLEIIMTEKMGGNKVTHGSQPVVLRSGSTGFIQVVQMRESFFN